MKERRENRNIRVKAENNGKKEGFNIYIIFSGQKEFLMHHRHNGLLYTMLKDGISLSDLRRWKPSQVSLSRTCTRRGSIIFGSVRHILSVADEYLAERCPTPEAA
jgi:hypothetical protein